LQAAFRILSDVVVYRVRKREMANLASSLTIMLAMRLGWQDVAARFVFALALNVAVYLVNDIYDVGADHASRSKDARKTEFLQAHRGAAWGAVWAPVLVMVALGLAWDRELLLILAVAGGACLAYSAWAKRVAFLDLPTILVCGITGSMLSFPLDRALGWCLAGLLGCFAMCFQIVQMVRDHDEDAAFGTRTTAVALGTRSTILLQRVLLAVAALYAALMVHRWVGAAMLLVVLLPFRAQQADMHWNRLRLALGIAWLLIIGWVWWTGTSYGWLLRLSYGDVLW
jgi:4-hydroxybenzoate polyprenyltransferase